MSIILAMVLAAAAPRPETPPAGVPGFLTGGSLSAVCATPQTDRAYAGRQGVCEGYVAGAVDTLQAMWAAAPDPTQCFAADVNVAEVRDQVLQLIAETPGADGKPAALSVTVLMGRLPCDAAALHIEPGKAAPPIYFLDGGKVLGFCSSKTTGADGEENSGTCAGYFSGVFDEMQVIKAMSTDVVACIPEDMNQVHDRALADLRADPKRQRLSAAFSIMETMRHTPCKAN